MFDLKHETFHHYCDVKRQLTGSIFDMQVEDSLAVAHSFNTFYYPNYPIKFGIQFTYLYNSYLNPRQCEQMEAKIKKWNIKLYKFLLSEHFSSYPTDGYKDWHLYTHRKCYSTAFYNYLKNDKLDELLNYGVPVNNIFEEIRFIGNSETVIILE